MKKASSFALLVFAALLMSFQSYAQISVENGRGQHGPGQQGQGPRGPRPGQGQQYPGQQYPDYGSYQPSEMLREDVRQTIRSYDRRELSELLRLSYGEEYSTQLITLSIRAQSLMAGPSQLQLQQNGRIISSASVSRMLSEVMISVPMNTLMSGLELSSLSDIYIDSISAQVQRGGYNPYPGPGRDSQVQPNQLVTLIVNQSVRGYANIDLEALARQQMGLTLAGAQLERVVVQGQSFGRAASVQVELNRRPVGEVKYLSPGQTPLKVQSLEEVRSLALIVNGDAQIQEIRIRVGQVRPSVPGPQYPQGPQGPQGPQYPGQTQRIYVGQELSSRYPMPLSGLLPYENRMIRSVTIEARSRVVGQAQIVLGSIYGGAQQGMLMVNQNSVRATIRLVRPMSAQELQLQTNSIVSIDALEIEFDGRYR